MEQCLNATYPVHAPMAYRDLEPISKQLTIVIGLTVVGFMAFGLALSFYRNVLFEETLLRIREQNRELEAKRDQGERDLEYYRSTQYKDKEAKEAFSRMQPGEKVLIITERTEDPMGVTLEDETTEEQEALFEEHLRQIPIIEHWKLYFFHREKIQELKRSL